MWRLISALAEISFSFNDMDEKRTNGQFDLATSFVLRRGKVNKKSYIGIKLFRGGGGG